MDMGKDNPVSIRFLNWAVPIKDDDIGRLFFTKLFEKVTNREVVINYSKNFNLGNKINKRWFWTFKNQKKYVKK